MDVSPRWDFVFSMTWIFPSTLLQEDNFWLKKRKVVSLGHISTITDTNYILAKFTLNP